MLYIGYRRRPKPPRGHTSPVYIHHWGQIRSSQGIPAPAAAHSRNVRNVDWFWWAGLGLRWTGVVQDLIGHYRRVVALQGSHRLIQNGVTNSCGGWVNCCDQWGFHSKQTCAQIWTWKPWNWEFVTVTLVKRACAILKPNTNNLIPSFLQHYLKGNTLWRDSRWRCSSHTKGLLFLFCFLKSVGELDMREILYCSMIRYTGEL